MVRRKHLDTQHFRGERGILFRVDPHQREYFRQDTPERRRPDELQVWSGVTRRKRENS